MSADAVACECGCGRDANPGRRFLAGHHQGLASRAMAAEHYARDDRAVAYYTGAADARYGRPRRVDLADTSAIGSTYHRGYDATVPATADAAAPRTPQRRVRAVASALPRTGSAHAARRTGPVLAPPRSPR